MKKQKNPSPSPAAEPVTEQPGKVSNPNARSAAFLLLIPAILALAASIWMAWQTMGTNLLFVASSKGQLYRQYPVFLVLGILLLLIAVILLRANPASALPPKADSDSKKGAAAPKTSAKDTAATETPVKDTPAAEAPAEQPADARAAVTEPQQKKRFCTNCGEEVAPDAKFCTKCGTPLDNGASAT